MKKLSIKDNDFLIAIRYRDFEKALAKPFTKERLEFYRPVIASKVYLFYSTNRSLCAKLGLDIGDIRQVVNCWAVNWVGLYETDRPDVENKKLFHAYIRQRLFRYKTILERKLRSCDLDSKRYYDSTDHGDVEEVESEEDGTIASRGRQASLATQDVLKGMGAKNAKLTLKNLISSSKDKEVIQAAKRHLKRLGR